MANCRHAGAGFAAEIFVCNGGEAVMAPEGMSVQWQLARDGKQFGPISALEMAKLIELGHLKTSDLIWRFGFIPMHLVPAQS